MPLFKKRKEVVDLTLLKKKGLLKESQQTPQTATPDYVDFSQPKQTQSPFSFLDSLASSASQTTQSTQQTSPDTNTQDLNVKLENLEYKLERLTEKLALIESKLQNFEDKTWKK